MLNLQIVGLKARADNYLWLVHDKQSALVVDPTEAQVVQDYLVKHRLNLQYILLTHKHEDHTAGAARLNELFMPHIIDNFNYQLNERQIINLGSLGEIEVLLTPGHTLEHVVYILNQRHLFCGDVLFSLGCGRIFSGDYLVAYASLVKLKQLAVTTLCYPAHEYTQKNLEFTLAFDPRHAFYAEFIDELTKRLALSAMSLPTSLATELKYNLFLRCANPYICQLVAKKSATLISDELQCFIALRKLRNDF